MFGVLKWIVLLMVIVLFLLGVVGEECLYRLRGVLKGMFIGVRVGMLLGGRKGIFFFSLWMFLLVIGFEIVWSL